MVTLVDVDLSFAKSDFTRLYFRTKSWISLKASYLARNVYAPRNSNVSIYRVVGGYLGMGCLVDLENRNKKNYCQLKPSKPIS